MIKLTSHLLVVCIAFSTGFSALAEDSSGPAKTDASAELLQKVNKYYSSGEYKDAIRVGEGIEIIDKYGENSQATASIYATMGTCTFLLAQKAEKEGDSKTALKYYRMAAGYNRAFASAVMIYHKTPGITKKGFDDEVEFYK